MTNEYIYCSAGVSHTHLNWQVMLWISLKVNVTYTFRLSSIIIVIYLAYCRQSLNRPVTIQVCCKQQVKFPSLHTFWIWLPFHYVCIVLQYKMHRQFALCTKYICCWFSNTVALVYILQFIPYPSKSNRSGNLRSLLPRILRHPSL